MHDLKDITGMEKKDRPKRVLLVANVVREHVLKFHVPCI